MSRFALALAAVVTLLCGNAQATVLTGSLTADNAFFAYISTDNTTRGTLVAQGNSWPTAYSLGNVTLTAGVTNYLHIEAINYGGPDMFLGQFSLSGTGFTFANGAQTLLTNATNWTVAYNNTNSDPNAQQAWVTPSTDTILNLGLNNGNGTWGTVSGISTAAAYIWGNAAQTSCQANGGYCTVDFSTAIYATSPVPVPGALSLLSISLLGFAGVRRAKIRA